MCCWRTRNGCRHLGHGMVICSTTKETLAFSQKRLTQAPVYRPDAPADNDFPVPKLVETAAAAEISRMNEDVAIRDRAQVVLKRVRVRDGDKAHPQSSATICTVSDTRS